MVMMGMAERNGIRIGYMNRVSCSGITGIRYCTETAVGMEGKAGMSVPLNFHFYHHLKMSVLLRTLSVNEAGTDPEDPILSRHAALNG